MNHLKTIIILALAFAIVGCDNKNAAAPATTASGGTSGGGGVAVVDMDRVAKAMGWMDEITKAMQQNEAELKNQLTDVVNTRVKAVEDTRTAVATEAKLTPEQSKKLATAKTSQDLDALPLTPQQRKELSDTVAKANADLQTAQVQYNEELRDRRSKLIVSYRERVRPIAARLAQARGVSMVFLPGDNLLYFDPKTADLTDPIIEELEKTKAPSMH